MDEQTQQRVDEFYKAKAEYENKLAKKKRKIMKDKTLTRSEKRRRIAELESRCPACKRNGSTTFKREPGKLVATCPSGSTCPASFTVVVPPVENLRQQYVELSGLNRELETDIIRAKLDLLFGYKTQDSALDEFRRLRPRAERVRTGLSNVERAYWKTVTRSADKQPLAVAQGALRDVVQEIKQISSEPGADSVRRAASAYADDVRPLVERIRGLKYADSRVLLGQPDGTEKLQLDPYTLSQLLVEPEMASAQNTSNE